MNSRVQSSSLVKKINKHDKISTANEFVSASYNIDLQLEKMILFAISVVNKFEMDKKVEFDFTTPVVVSADNMVELMYDYDPSVALTYAESQVRLQRLRSITRSMKRFYTDLKTFPAMEVKRDEVGISEKIPMISKLAFDAKNRTLSIFFPKEFYEYFYKMASDAGVKPFNKHEIKYIMKMEYYFSLRLYRFLNAHLWRNRQPLIIEYDSIRVMLDKTNTNSYVTHQKIKEKLIEPAIKEINEFTNLDVAVTYLKIGGKYSAIQIDFEYKANYIEATILKRIEALKVKLLKAAAPWDDNGDHFKHKDRHLHFQAPKKLSPKQITALVNQPVFLNDYGKFIGTLETDVAKEVMASLLATKLDLINEEKPIDLDYYLEWLRYKSSGAKEDSSLMNEED